MNITLKIILLLLCFIFGFQSFGQNKTKLFIDYGLGFQFSKTKIPNAKYNSLVNSPVPKLFLACGAERKINKRMSLCFSLNTNFSKTETQFNYFNDSDQFSYNSNDYHRDINYGLALGIKYFPLFGRGRFSIGTGINLQKLSAQEIFNSFSFKSGIDSDTSLISTIQITNSNNFEKNYNSVIYYLNAGYNLGNKRKMDFIFELNSTLNKPVWGTNEFYYNNYLIERTKFKVNMAFFVFKIRRRF